PSVLLLRIMFWFFTHNIQLSITALVLGCPGVLVIGVPVFNVSEIGNGARHGFLLKGSEVIHDFSKVDTIVFDKTGTLTIGNPEVAEKEFYGDHIEETLGYLASVERESDHPLAKAILQDIGDTPFYTVEKTVVIKCAGIIAYINSHRVAVCNVALIEKEQVPLLEKVKMDIQRFERNGNSLVLTAIDGELKVLMGIRDTIRPGV